MKMLIAETNVMNRWLVLWFLLVPSVVAKAESPNFLFVITGRYPHNTGAPELHMELPAEQVTFVESLRRRMENPEHAPTLARMRKQFDIGKTATSDSVQEKPTPDRQPIHDVGKKPPVYRGEMPGELHQAAKINHPGPVRSTVHSLD